MNGMSGNNAFGGLAMDGSSSSAGPSAKAIDGNELDVDVRLEL
jgi:hypothetical protein